MTALFHILANILIIADAQSIMAGRNQCVYMVDDNSPPSTGEGTPALTTIAPPGTSVIWRAVTIDNSTDIKITNIHRQSATSVFDEPPVDNGDGTWGGILGNFGKGTKETYETTITIGSKIYAWEAYVVLN